MEEDISPLQRFLQEEQSRKPPTPEEYSPKIERRPSRSVERRISSEPVSWFLCLLISLSIFLACIFHKTEVAFVLNLNDIITEIMCPSHLTFPC